MALKDIGAIAKEEQPAPDELNDGLIKLNFMLDAWSVRSLMVLGSILEAFPLMAGKYVYTIGINGDFATSRPSAITTAFIRDQYNTDTGVDIAEIDLWSALTDKAIATGRPEILYYDRGITQQTSFLGVINLYPAPDTSSSYKLFIGEQKALNEFAKVTDTVSFQQAYMECIEYNLAIRLWPQYHEDGKPISTDLKSLAKESMRVLETTNAKQPKATIEVQGRVKGGSTYNVYTGNYQ
jgi:hypothetical protein